MLSITNITDHHLRLQVTYCKLRRRRESSEIRKMSLNDETKYKQHCIEVESIIVARKFARPFSARFFVPLTSNFGTSFRSLICHSDSLQFLVRPRTVWPALWVYSLNKYFLRARLCLQYQEVCDIQNSCLMMNIWISPKVSF